MKKQDRGTVLTSVILMVLVMTLIGVPLLGMVVYNYQLRERDNSLRRSEYETEIVMDRIYLKIRETVIKAIEEAKKNATESVNNTSELQRTQYASVRATYEDKWNDFIDDYGVTETNYSTIISAVVVAEPETAYAGAREDLELGEGQVSSITTDALVDATIEEAKEIYVNDRVAIRLNAMSDEELMGIMADADNTGVLVDSEGMLDDVALKTAYNLVFAHHYRNYVETNVLSNINDELSYASEISFEDYRFNDDTETTSGSYLKINAGTEEALNVNVAVKYRKAAKIFPSSVSATFIIGIPDFDTVSQVEQYTVALSNPITNQGVTVGETLELADNTTLRIANDMTVCAYNTDDGIILNEGSGLLAQIGSEEEATNSRIAVNGDIVMKKSSNLVSGTNPLYYRNLYVGEIGDTGTYNITFKGNVLAKDDLEINTDGNVTVTQVKDANYYGFNDKNDEGPDSSSSIVLNTTNFEEGRTLSLTFGNLYLAGRAFIDGVFHRDRMNHILDANGDYIKTEDGEYIKNTEGIETTEKYRRENVIYKTGESIAIKGNYIAYQMPLSESGSTDKHPTENYRSDNVVFSPYVITRDSNTEEEEQNYSKNYVINLADAWATDNDYGKFDVNKCGYFYQYVQQGNPIDTVKVDATIKHLQGTGFDKNGNVTTHKIADETSFKNNREVEYERYTKYFGQNTDSENAKTEIFGANGWISNSTSLDVEKTPSGDSNYWMIYDKNSASQTIAMSGTENKGIIIVTGDLNIEVTGNATFSGMIVVGGNLTITGGGTLTLTDSKEEVINTIIGNYLGDTNVSDATGITDDGLYEIFTYDGSGTTYVVTEVVDDSLVNVNDLINITNWTKQDTGRL